MSKGSTQTLSRQTRTKEVSVLKLLTHRPIPDFLLRLLQRQLNNLPHTCKLHQSQGLHL